MHREIEIRIGSITVEAELVDNATSDAIWEALPFDSNVNTWGKEVYFTIPVTVELKNGREVVNSGDIAYWPPGKAFCIFFGPTPASRGGEIRAASKVNVFGKLIGEPGVLSSALDGDKIFVARAI